MTNFRKLHFQNYFGSVTSFIGELGSIFFDPLSTTLRIGDGVTPGGTPVSGGGSSLPTIQITYANQAETSNDSVGNIGSSGILWFQGGAADVLYTVTSSDTITETGTIQWYAGAIVATTGGIADTGDLGVRFLAGSDATDFVVMAFATNPSGTVYSAPSPGISRILCLAAGTRITLSDGNYKLVEDIDYNDMLLVWDFDNRCFAESKPLWIKQHTPAHSYNELTFDNGSVLHTVGQHRIFNKQLGKFTYPMTDDTPIGTITYNEFGQEVTLVKKRIVFEETTSCNIITDYHMNLFGNSILTSSSFNNLYPIKNMQFVKDERTSRFFKDVPVELHYGLRLAEQQMDEIAIRIYLTRLDATSKMQLA